MVDPPGRAGDAVVVAVRLESLSDGIVVTGRVHGALARLVPAMPRSDRRHGRGRRSTSSTRSARSRRQPSRSWRPDRPGAHGPGAGRARAADRPAVPAGLRRASARRAAPTATSSPVRCVAPGHRRSLGGARCPPRAVELIRLRAGNLARLVPSRPHRDTGDHRGRSQEEEVQVEVPEPSLRRVEARQPGPQHVPALRERQAPAHGLPALRLVQEPRRRRRRLMLPVAVDAMGGDRAPGEIVAGAHGGRRTRHPRRARRPARPGRPR